MVPRLKLILSQKINGQGQMAVVSYTLLIAQPLSNTLLFNINLLLLT